MSGRAVIETDYLVVGAGALGMGFVDELISHSDVDVVMIDRRHRPGGHWLDSYPFVQLHQPSMNYGVNSTPLGLDRVESDGRDAGFYERAAGSEICGYYDEVMRHRLLASGRVRFLPMTDYLGNGRLVSRLNGNETQVSARRNVVDATYMATRVPATDAPPFEVADGVPCVPVGDLTKVATPPAGYVVIGAGKTGMDAVCWLVDQGTSPDDVTWVRPQDSWILNREFFQPGEGVVRTFEGVVVEVEATAESESIEQVYARLEKEQVMLRIDDSVEPGMCKGATASSGELQVMRRINRVVRLGHVKRIEESEIVFEHGSIPTSREHLHVHCASAGLSDRPPKIIFDDDVVMLQPVTRVSLSLSAALLGYVEASDRSTAEKNQLCPPNAWPQTPFDWTRSILAGIRTEVGWGGEPDLQSWLEASRLNLLKGIGEHPDHDAVTALQGRFLTALGPALRNLDVLATQATPAERARMFEPAV
jgi:hypothetical protein